MTELMWGSWQVWPWALFIQNNYFVCKCILSCGKGNSYFLWLNSKIICDWHWCGRRSFETLPLTWNSYKDFVPQDRASKLYGKQAPTHVFDVATQWGEQDERGEHCEPEHQTDSCYQRQVWSMYFFCAWRERHCGIKVYSRIFHLKS